MLCHTKHIPKVPTRPFRHLDERDYDGELDTCARPGLREFIRKVLDLAHVVAWSSMVMENTKPIINFPFCDLPSPCLVLGQEACDKLLDEKGLPVPKFGGRGRGQRFLKILGSKLWRGIPPLEGVPHGNWPTPENTILIGDNPTKSVLNPPGNVIFPDPWTSDREDTFLVDRLAPYLRRLVLHPGGIPDFVRSNPISNAALNPAIIYIRASCGSRNSIN